MRYISIFLNIPTVALWIILFANLKYMVFSTVIGVFLSILMIWLVMTAASFVYWYIIGNLDVGCLTAIPYLTLAGIIAIILPAIFQSITYTLTLPSLYHLIILGAIIGLLRWPDYLIYKNVRVPAPR